MGGYPDSPSRASRLRVKMPSSHPLARPDLRSTTVRRPMSIASELDDGSILTHASKIANQRRTVSLVLRW